MALAAILMPCMVGGAAAQSQLGSDIDGEAAGDLCGSSVSLSSDGGRVAVGAYLNGGSGSFSGHVRIYEWTGAVWMQLGTDIDGEAATDLSGFSVSLSSDGGRVAIGAPGNDDNGSSAGHVRVYTWSGSAWMQLGSDIDGEAGGDGSGFSVSLSADGNRVAIGARDNNDSGPLAGHVRVYEWSGSAWMQLGSDIDAEATGDQFGSSVSLSSSGGRLAIGAILNDGNGSGSGHVRVYEWSGSAWMQLGSDIDGEAAGDETGWSVSLSSDGSRVAMGAPNNDDAGANAGHARVFEWSGLVWQQLGSDIDGVAVNDQSGRTISLSADGNRVAIGAIENDGSASNAGHVRMFDWTGTSWVQFGSDIDGEAENDYSGWSVSLSANGSRVAIGAVFNDGGGVDAGHVRVYGQAPVAVGLSRFTVE